MNNLPEDRVERCATVSPIEERVLCLGRSCERDNDDGREEGQLSFQGSRRVQYFAAFAANMGAVALGTALSWSAVALPDLRKECAIPMTTTEESWIGSIVILGASAAGPAIGLTIESLGRRMSMLILAIPCVFGWLFIYFANSVSMILIGRFITGFCSGAFATAAPIFTAEIADISVRGPLCAGFEIMIGAGVMLMFMYSAYFGWRMQALISAIFPLVIFLMMLFVPESPRYLVQRGKLHEATSALMRFRGTSLKENVEPELRVLKISVRSSQDKYGGWRGLFSKPVLRPVSIAFFIYLFQIDPVLFYTVDIFETTASTSIDEYSSTIIIGSVQVVSSLFGAFLVEHVGRRLLLMISEVAMVISLLVLGYCFLLKQENGNVTPEDISWLPLSCLIVYVISYSIGMGPVGYMIIGEILPHGHKGAAGCFLTSVKWLMTFILNEFYLDFIQLLGNAGVSWVFGVFCVMGALYIFVEVPETKGKSLDEIQREFALKTEEERKPLLQLTYN